MSRVGDSRGMPETTKKKLKNNPSRADKAAAERKLMEKSALWRTLRTTKFA
jgi:hypothetical protein